ncbi:MAG: CpXC domain-containing protein [Sulfitobacter sp.]
MSLFSTSALTCPKCETTTDFPAAGSVNADRRPDLRQAILDDNFQTMACPTCAEVLRLEPLVNYLDVASGLWMAAYPARQLGAFGSLEAEAQALFDESYGSNAPQPAREVGAQLHARLTFGWPATREKILIRHNGLDDVLIEMLKLDLLRRLPQAPLRPGVDLRLIAISEDSLDFVWIENDSETILSGFEARRTLLTDIEENQDQWAPTRPSLVAGMFVDIQRVLFVIGA